MKRIFIFDLDDTLYDERTYVTSGFRAVAAWLARRYSVGSGEILRQMEAHLDQFGRGAVFDAVLRSHGIYSRRLVAQCVGVYRSHLPKLTLYPDAVACLARLRGQPVYIVTDGNKHVQQRKLEALGLHAGYGIRKCYITRRYGIRNEKPSPYCFLQICRKEHAQPHQAVYIGDNPRKDFVGIKPLGFRTVRVRRGAYKGEQPAPGYDADWTIDTLDQLNERLIADIFASS
jgi:putative hydrolase of the HAD superfamily